MPRKATEAMRKAEFIQTVEKTFWALESKYGFKKTATTFRTNDVIVTFQNATTSVVLNYEIGQMPWLTIADITDPENKHASLDWLLVELGQQKAPAVEEAFSTRALENDKLEAELQRQVQALLTFGADMLNGDFSILPKLQKRADNYLAECKKFAERHKVKA